MSTDLQNHLELPYSELEELNLRAKEERLARVPAEQIQGERLKYLSDEKRIKAVTVLFSDLEGRLHMLDYDKKFFIKSWDNLTFDGSSIRGFSAQHESDLRLGIDWPAFYWGPADVFGPGKVMVFGEVIDKNGKPYAADLRAVLKAYAWSLYEKDGYTLNAANEIEGFMFKGTDASGAITKPASSSMSAWAGTTTPFPATRCVCSSTALRKCSGRWDFKTKRTTRKSRLRSSKSTTGMRKWWPRPTKSRFTD